jgi:prepilin-type N-terminal cleavage/methylation domain-containing protein
MAPPTGRFPGRAGVRARNGFSLIEILVAVALISVIMLALMAMLNQTQRAFRGSMAQVDVMEGGRSVTDLIRRDLSGLVLCNQPGVTNFRAIETLGLLVTQDLPTGGRRTNMFHDLYFLGRQNDEWVGIAYVVGANNNVGAGTLYRLEDRADHTNDLALFAGDFYGATPDDVNTRFHRVADGIVHFQVRTLNADGYVILTNNAVDLEVIGKGFWEDCSFAGNQMPSMVDVELGVLEPKTWEQVKARSSAAAQIFLKERADKIHLFRLAVPIRAVP